MPFLMIKPQSGSNNITDSPAIAKVLKRNEGSNLHKYPVDSLSPQFYRCKPYTRKKQQ
jgi:hypothetical protein